MPFWVPLAMMGAGMLKNQLVDKPAQKRQNEAQAAQTEFSPLTGMGPGQIQKNPSTLGAGLKWGSTGLALNQALGAAGGLGGAGAANAASQQGGALTSRGIGPLGNMQSVNQAPVSMNYGNGGVWPGVQNQPGLYNA